MEYKSQHTSATPTGLTFKLLEHATNNFSDDHIIGSGSYGVVYKGILGDGQEIAVKKLYPQLFDGVRLQQQYNELIDINHENIVRLVSCCQETRYKHIEHKGELVFAKLQEIALCSEYLPGGSLDKHVSDESRGLHWHTRYKIIKGICEGLNHLHSSRGKPIYHMNLKITNILLDRNMVPKIGDLETSRMRMQLEDYDGDHTMGTMRYLPPEYIDSGSISKKMDVFSLGIIIIQIMAGDDAVEKRAEMPPQEFIELVHENWRKRFQTTMLFPSASHEVRTCIRIALMCVERDRNKRPTISNIVHELNKIDTSPMSQVHRTREFTFELLNHITNHFSSECELGRGGFGVVYKGILDDGEEIAVKKLKSMPLLDDHQFNNELNNLKTLEHPNIVRLVGYCHDTTLVNVEHNGRVVCAAVEERALCYEYLEEGSLDKYLSDESCGFDWHVRYKIIRGISAGLHYLQNGSKHPIYHLDLKPANILLDKDMMPKIGDFGLSRLFDLIQTYLTQSQNSPGTPGYMPPEYIDEHQISPKFDIFSFGVIIIQIMIGKNGRYSYATMAPKEFIKLVQEKWKKRMPEAMWPHTSEEVKTCIELALRCVDTNREKRPSITEIIDELNNIGTAKSTPKIQWPNKLMDPKTSILSENFKDWLFLLLAIIIMYSSWPLLLSR
nr:wheat tandem kinase WTK-TM [Triticum dicoccoides]